MPHSRFRFAQDCIQKLAKLWPVVGVVGARQTGKTTLLCQRLKLGKVVSLDDEETRLEAQASSTAFLERRPPPLILDEVQKSPNLFDSIKLRVDRKRIPGSYFLTGSTEFSERMGIRESLTGRIGLMQLYPMNFAEAVGDPSPTWRSLLHGSQTRYPPEKLAAHALKGGLPVPAFLRDETQVKGYWRGWTETTVLRDLRRVYGKGYEPEVTECILREFAQASKKGELVTLSQLSLSSKKLRQYLSAMETLFLVRRIPMHPRGKGLEFWLLLDSGLLKFLMNQESGEGPSLSLIRHSIWNELLSNHEYRLGPYRPVYYKSAKGSPVDWIDERLSCAFKIVIHGRSGELSYSERALAGCMKAIGLERGFLITPIATPDIPRRKGIGLLPWTYWS